MSSVSSLNSLLSSSSTSSNSSIDLSSLLAAATGASSVGIDVTSAVDAAIYAARAPERVWQSQQTTIQSQTAALTSIQSAVSTVTADLDTLNDPAGVVGSNTVSSTDSSVVTATATTGATAANHTIVVQNLATNTSWYSAPLASATSPVGTSVFSLTLADGTQKNFTPSSLSDLASSINSAGMGISASIVSDATGSRLSLVSQTTGTDSNFSVSVDSPGTNSWSSASIASATTALAASTLNLGDGSATASFSIAAGSSLKDVASQINRSGLNVAASVVTDAAGARLSVASTDGSTISMSSDPVLSFIQSSKGKDAQLQVDGVPVVSSTDVVNGAIPGVTLNLAGASTGSATTLVVAANSTQISSAISQFVTDYNSALSLVNSQFTYSSTTNSQGALGSDATVRSLQSAMLGITSYSPSSLNGSSNSSLASLGISVNDDGSLALDSTKLNQALDSDPSSVRQFLLGSGLNGFAANAKAALNAFSAAGSGVLTSDISSLTQEYNDLQSHISDFETGYIASQQTILTNMYSQAEAALQQLPATLKEIQAQLGNGSSGS